MPSKRANQNSDVSSRGRVGNIGGMVNQTVSSIISLFMNLSERSQQDTLLILGRIAGGIPPAAERSQPVHEPPTGTSQRSPVSNSARVHAWDRPPVSNLPYAIRQKGRAKPDRNSEQGRVDGKLLSAAIAAVNRARILQISEESLVSALERAGEDLERIKTLFPRKSEEVVLDSEEQAVVDLQDPLYGPSGTRKDGPLSFTIVTDTVLAGDDIITGEDPPELKFVPSTHLVHLLCANLASGKRLSLSEQAIAFTEKKVRNYTEIARYFRYRNSDGRILLVDVPLRWGDQDSDSDGNPSSPRRSRSGKKVRTKKRKSFILDT